MTGVGVTTVDLEDLSFAEGAQLLLKRAFRNGAKALRVRGRDPALTVDLPAWTRTQGHQLCREDDGSFTVTAATFGQALAPVSGRWLGAERAGDWNACNVDAVVETAPARWGLAARGAAVEAGSPAFSFRLSSKREVWSEDAGRLYALAAANQWDPATAIPWEEPFDLPPEVEEAVVSVMTYLIENETAALVVPARFLGQLHPHFREVMQMMATIVADEARHIEVFTRRATLRGAALGLSTAGGQTSLATLLDEPDFAVASFLLSVLGEGSFLSLLWFLHEHAPDPVTRAIAKLTAQDEARHVAFGLSHLARHLQADPALEQRLAAAVERRHAHLSHTAGLNEEVFDALVLLAAGSFTPAALRNGSLATAELGREMERGRRQRLVRLGFSEERAANLASLHTKNFM
jgi:hypothetical protein